MTVKATHAVQRISCFLAHSARGAQRHRAGHMQRETRDCPTGAASFIRLSCPVTRQTTQTHPTYPTPHGGARSAERAPRSSTCTLLVVVEAAGP
eukprot:5280019-Prymnesium_polylepis.1